MSLQVSFTSANVVAREPGFDTTGGWSQGDRATSEDCRVGREMLERCLAVAA